MHMLQDAAKSGNEEDVEQCGDKGSDQSPPNYGVPGSRPEKLNGTPEIRVRKAVNLRHVEWQVRRTEQYFAQTEKWNQECNLRWIQEVVQQLNRRHIQTPEKSDQSTERAAPAEQRDHTDDR